MQSGNDLVDGRAEIVVPKLLSTVGSRLTMPSQCSLLFSFIWGSGKGVNRRRMQRPQLGQCVSVKCRSCCDLEVSPKVVIPEEALHMLLDMVFSDDLISDGQSFTGRLFWDTVVERCAHGVKDVRQWLLQRMERFYI